MENQNVLTPEQSADATKPVAANSVVLGHLQGPCANFLGPTRNGRKYGEELWDRVFKDPIVKEYFDCGGIFGELGHPTDRDETDMSKIALCMPKAPEKKDGQLIATFDILNTPNGKILKALCDYGYKMGISSRGSGDLITDYDGQESVDPETYTFNAFDAVLLPAVKEARLAYSPLNAKGIAVAEALDTKKAKKVPLTEALHKLCESASDEDKKIMTETIENLNLNENEQLDEMANPQCLVYLVDNMTSKRTRFTSANRAIAWLQAHPEVDPVNYSIVWERYEKSTGELLDRSVIIEGDELDELIWNLRNGINESLALKAITEALRTELDGTPEEFKNFSESILLNIKKHLKEGVIKKNAASVDNGATADKIMEELQEALAKNAQLEKQVANLKETLSVCNTKKKSLEETLDTRKSDRAENAELSKKVNALTTRIQGLSESLESEKANADRFKTRISTLNAQLKEAKKAAADDTEVKHLRESVEELKKDKDLQKSEFTAKLKEAKVIIAKNKKLTENAVDRYIELQANRLGVTSTEIKNKLDEQFTLDDVDEACKGLQQYQLSIGQLPFNTELRESVRVKASSRKDPILREATNSGDDIDKSLLMLAGL